MQEKKFKIVLVAPDIPGNTGSIGRTCVALGLELILIKPLGFDISEKAVRRAGLDYWKYVQTTIYETFEEFLKVEKPTREQLLFFENNVDQNFYNAPYLENSYLIFGSETKGLSPAFYEEYRDQVYHLPMFSPYIRSLNLSNTVTTVAYECLRCLHQ